MKQKKILIILLGTLLVGCSQVTTKELIVEEVIPFETTTFYAKSSNEDTESSAIVKNEGVDGLRERTYRVSYKNGVEVKREQTNDRIIIQPIPHVISIGFEE